ncbi:hypothetical protein ABZW96_05570 [Nocardia sp. NPDC004168]|uniref:hypothetical protein n=1 Tax=Nocardia sp. NPDC004168 TaxID=3154452 RepID=UPI0033ACF786
MRRAVAVSVSPRTGGWPCAPSTPPSAPSAPTPANGHSEEKIEGTGRAYNRKDAEKLAEQDVVVKAHFRPFDRPLLHP